MAAAELADLLGVPPSALAREERGRRGILWRYEPSTGQTGRLADRLRQLAVEVRPSRALTARRGIRKVSLGIEVRYDTATCTVVLPTNRLVYGHEAVGTSLPELSSLELTCTGVGSDGAACDTGQPGLHDRDRTVEEMRERYKAWEAAGRPGPRRPRSPLVVDPGWASPYDDGATRRRRADANTCMVSLDAITSASASCSKVADVLGVPAASLLRHSTRDGAIWSCPAEAEETVGLAERISFLAATVHPRRPIPRVQRNVSVKWIYLDIGVSCDNGWTETCRVSLPLAGIRAMVHKLLVHDVEVVCYPDLKEYGVGSAY